MKTSSILTLVCLISLPLLVFPSKYKGKNDTNSILKDSSDSYLDGTYQGQSQSYYTSEPFWGRIQVKVVNGAFTEINFTIRDSSAHEPVDSMYGVHHYAGVPEYQQQCVNDGHGIEIYPQKLLTSQNIDEVDAITGATWSYNIFISTIKNALKDAKKTSGIVNQSSDNKINLDAFPNPSNSSIILKYNIHNTCHVKIDIYDTEGRLISKLVDDNYIPGEYNIMWNCPSSGTYFYRFIAGDMVLSGKLINSK